MHVETANRAVGHQSRSSDRFNSGREMILCRYGWLWQNYVPALAAVPWLAVAQYMFQRHQRPLMWKRCRKSSRCGPVWSSGASLLAKSSGCDAPWPRRWPLVSRRS